MLVAASLATTGARAQGLRVKASPDPYTKNDPALLQQLGYENLGPFEFGSNQSCASIENLLGTEPLMWVETKHFRLGCSLPGIPVKGLEDWRRDWQKSLYKEIAELRKVFPKLKKKPKNLDPWLRTHLYAMRLERIYGEVMDVLGVDDAWFPDDIESIYPPEKYRGKGPYCGMANKFTVLLLRTGASHARYTRAYHGFEMAEPMRIHDLAFGSLYWGCSAESANGLFYNDWALHANLAFNVSHNLYTGFRGFTHDLPAWIATGLGHWHARRVAPRFPTYDRKDDQDKDPRSPFWQWGERVRGLVKNKVFEDCGQFVERLDAGKYGIEQHMQAWALVSYLLEYKKPQFAMFLHRMKDPFHAMRRLPTGQELLVRQHDSLALAFDANIDAIDVEWRASVLSKKKKRRR